MKNMIVIAFVLLLSACSLNQTGTQFSSDTVNSFEKGVTTASDVRAALGNPTSINHNSDGTQIWTYHASETKTNGAEWIPIAGIFLTEATTQSSTAIIQMSSDGTVQDVQFTESAFNTK